MPDPEAMAAFSPEGSAVRHFEDFRLGQRFRGGDRVVTADDIEAFAGIGGDRHPLHTDADHARRQGFAGPLVHGPFVLAAFFGWFHELGVARDAIIGLLDTNWRYLAPVHAGDRIRFEMTITRCRLAASRDRGVIGRHVRVLDARAEVVQEGTTAVLVRARGAGPRHEQELFTAAWARLLAERLNADERFTAATATWDGTIGLATERDETQLRVYRGRVLEAGVRTPAGPTFTVVASELAWAEMIAGPQSDFMKRAMQGAFSVRGSAYEYLRLTKAIGLLVDDARQLYRRAEGR